MRKNPWLIIGLLVVIVVGSFIVFIGSATYSLFHESEVRVSQNSILVLDLEGVIINGKKFLKNLKKYAKEPQIKAIVIRVNSPGGVVAPSEEIHDEILRVRNDFKKPVVVSASSLMASGAYYVAVASDKIIVNRGTLMGSIGVIMEFANLEKLYNWAKIERYSITTGKYKDSGAEYRPMRDDERALFQVLINQVLEQFKKAVADGRKIRPEILDEYADGRIFNGEDGKKLGFADEIGTFEDALKEAATLAGLGQDYETVEPMEKKGRFFDFFADVNEEESWGKATSKLLGRVLKPDLIGRPLYLMPGAI